MSALCSRCKKEPPKEGQRYCPPCIAAYMREWRARKTAKWNEMKALLARRGASAA